MNAFNSRQNSYQEVAVKTATPVRLVTMLYEGAIRYLRQAADAVQARDLGAKHQAVDRAMAIIQHLQGTLDLERGRNVAADLDRLFDYISTRVFAGSSKMDAAPIEEVIQLLTMLLSGWQEVARHGPGNQVPAPLLAQQTQARRFDIKL